MMVLLASLAMACDPPQVAVRAAEARKRFLNDGYGDALVSARQTIEGLACADVLVPRSDLVALFQVAVAAASEVDDGQQARIWATTAASLLPGVPWDGEALGAAGAVYWNAAQTAPRGVGTVTTRGPVWIDGRPFSGKAELSVPLGVHLVQEVDEQAMVRSVWIDVQADALAVGTAVARESEQSAARPWLLGGGATLVGLGAVGMFIGAEDLFCAGQLQPGRPEYDCLPLIHDYGTVTQDDDYRRLLNRGTALRKAGAAAVGIGTVTLVLGWRF